MARASTLALDDLWVTEQPRDWLPTWAAAAPVGALGVVADGGVVALMLPGAALVDIWGHKTG